MKDINDTMKKAGRKIAYHELWMPDGSIVKLGVVSVVDGVVADVQPLKGEMPMTEWKGGTAQIKKDENGHLVLYEGDTIVY